MSAATAGLPRGWRIDLLDDLDPLAERWEALAERSRNVFSSWTWADAWLRTLGAEAEPVIGAVEDDHGALRAVLPLARSSRAGIKLLRFIGHGPADELAPISAPEDEAAAMDALKTLLEREKAGWDVFLAERMPAGSRAEWSNAHVLRQEPSPLVRGPDGWEAYLKERSSNFRSQVRSKERRLGREHRLEYRLSDGSPDDLDLLFDLHRRRWGDDTPFLAAEPFHRRFAAAASEKGWLRYWILELDDEPAGAWYGFRYGGVESYYQAGRDPDRSRDSVGFVLLAHTIRAAFEDGVEEYRLLRGDEDYKDRFATDAQQRETFAVPGSVAGSAAVRAGAMLMEHGPLRRMTGALID